MGPSPAAARLQPSTSPASAQAFRIMDWPRPQGQKPNHAPGEKWAAPLPDLGPNDCFHFPAHCWSTSFTPFGTAAPRGGMIAMTIQKRRGPRSRSDANVGLQPGFAVAARARVRQREFQSHPRTPLAPTATEKRPRLAAHCSENHPNQHEAQSVPSGGELMHSPTAGETPAKEPRTPRARASSLRYTQ